MKKTIYILHILWVIASTTIGIISKNWVLCLSWLWFPLLVVLSIAFLLTLSTDIGKILKKRQESKIEDSCDICLFKQTAKYGEDGKCLGCAMDESHKMGEMCSYYKRHLGKTL